MRYRSRQQGCVMDTARRMHGTSLTPGRRWKLLMLSGVVGLLGLGVIAVQGAPFAYITNSGTPPSGGTVSVIDTATNTVEDTVTVGNSPWGVAVHPAGTFVYVTLTSLDIVSVIDTTRNNEVVATVPVGGGPIGVAVHPAGTFVYVANRDSDTVSVIDTATNTEIDVDDNSANGITRIPVGIGPFSVAVHPAGIFVYVTNILSNTLSVINTADNTVTATVVQAGSTGLAFHPTGTRLYLSNGLVIDTDPSSQTFNAAVDTVQATVYGRGIAMHPAGTFVYWTHSTSGPTISVIDTATNSEVAKVTVGDGPIGVAVHPAGTHVYVANHFDHTVSVIDITDPSSETYNTEVKIIPVGNAPTAEGLFIGPASSSCLGAGPRSLQGTVKRKAGSVNPSTTLTLNSPGGCQDTTTTNSKGKYAFNGLASGSYTVTPSKSGCSFTPASRTVTIAKRNVSANFTGTCP